MVGPVIVRAVADYRRQAKGLVPGADEMVRGGFRRGIGRIRLIAALFAELAVGAERTEYLVCGDVVEAERGAALFRQSVPVVERRLEQRVGPLDIGLDEFAGPVDRAVDMRFRGEVQ